MYVFIACLLYCKKVGAMAKQLKSAVMANVFDTVADQNLFASVCYLT